LCARDADEDHGADPSEGMAVTPLRRRCRSHRGRSGNTACTDCDTQPERLRYDTISSTILERILAPMRAGWVGEHTGAVLVGGV